MHAGDAAATTAGATVDVGAAVGGTVTTGAVDNGVLLMVGVVVAASVVEVDVSADSLADDVTAESARSPADELDVAALDGSAVEPEHPAKNTTTTQVNEATTSLERSIAENLQF